jgi:hypothetical protein
MLQDVGVTPVMQDVKDNHEEAAKVAPQTLQLCNMVSIAVLQLRKPWVLSVSPAVFVLKTRGDPPA